MSSAQPHQRASGILDVPENTDCKTFSFLKNSWIPKENRGKGPNPVRLQSPNPHDRTAKHFKSFAVKY